MWRRTRVVEAVRTLEQVIRTHLTVEEEDQYCLERLVAFEMVAVIVRLSRYSLFLSSSIVSQFANVSSCEFNSNLSVQNGVGGNDNILGSSTGSFLGGGAVLVYLPVL